MWDKSQVYILTLKSGSSHVFVVDARHATLVWSGACETNQVHHMSWSWTRVTPHWSEVEHARQTRFITCLGRGRNTGLKWSMRDKPGSSHVLVVDATLVWSGACETNQVHRSMWDKPGSSHVLVVDATLVWSGACETNQVHHMSWSWTPHWCEVEHVRQKTKFLHHYIENHWILSMWEKKQVTKWTDIRAILGYQKAPAAWRQPPHWQISLVRNHSDRSHVSISPTTKAKDDQGKRKPII
jgi:hypothetical protein